MSSIHRISAPAQPNATGLAADAEAEDTAALGDAFAALLAAFFPQATIDTAVDGESEPATALEAMIETEATAVPGEILVDTTAVATETASNIVELPGAAGLPLAPGLESVHPSQSHPLEAEQATDAEIIELPTRDLATAAATVAKTAEPNAEPTQRPEYGIARAALAATNKRTSAAADNSKSSEAIAGVAEKLGIEIGSSEVSEASTSAPVVQPQAVRAQTQTRPNHGGEADDALLPEQVSIDEPVWVEAVEEAAVTAPLAVDTADETVEAPDVAIDVTARAEVRAVENAAPGEPVRAVARPVHSQVVNVITPLRQAPNGAYRLTLQLHPEDLGPVQLHVELRDDHVSLVMEADTESAQEILRNSLPELRNELEAGGLRAEDLDVGLRQNTERDEQSFTSGSTRRFSLTDAEEGSDTDVVLPTQTTTIRSTAPGEPLDVHL